MTQKIKPLSQMQYNFCSAYIRNGFNGYQAAITAGYTKKSALVHAHKLLEKPLIKEKVMTAYQKAEAQLGIDFLWKLTKLKRVVEQCIPDDETKKLKPLYMRVGLQALGELNKMQGDYAPEKRLSMTVDATQAKLLEARKQYKDY